MRLIAVEPITAPSARRTAPPATITSMRGCRYSSIATLRLLVMTSRSSCEVRALATSSVVVPMLMNSEQPIGIAAAARIPNGCSLFINIGTTREEVASALTSHEDLLVITNNLNVAMLLYRHPRIEVFVAGGAVRRADGAVIGSTAISLIGQFKVDYAIIGASAIDEEGALLDFDYREVQAAQAIIANARSVMLVADSTKLRRSAPVRIAHISQIQTFVTDAALPAGLANICHTRGIEVIEAMPTPATDLDEPGAEPAPPPAAIRLR